MSSLRTVIHMRMFAGNSSSDSFAKGGAGEESMCATEYLKLKSNSDGYGLNASRIGGSRVW
jgi:hypothetical protein